MRILYENYKELPSHRTRYWGALRFMYGVTGKLTVMFTGTASNHHPRKLPSNLQSHFLNHHTSAYPPNPLLIEGFNLYARYRLVSLDGQQKHLRVAIYGEGAKSFAPHDEAEPVLMGDNSGLGGGMIITQLYKKFAVSLTAGYAYPFPYKDQDLGLSFRSGDMYSYNISMGYRIFPFTYSDYSDINVNFYVEFINRHYQGAQMVVNGKEYDFEQFKHVEPFTYNSLQENKYSEIRPSIQIIVNSNNRIDLGIAQPFIGRSYLHFYPVYYLSFQKYFFPPKKK